MKILSWFMTICFLKEQTRSVKWSICFADLYYPSGHWTGGANVNPSAIVSLHHPKVYSCSGALPTKAQCVWTRLCQICSCYFIVYCAYSDGHEAELIAFLNSILYGWIRIISFQLHVFIFWRLKACLCFEFLPCFSSFLSCGSYRSL